MITPYICSPDARAALDWYRERLGARVTVEPMLDDGRVGHCEFEVFGGRVMMSDEYALADVAPPEPQRGAAVTLVGEADDLEAIARAVTEGGGRITRGPEEGGPTGRILVFRDPFGHRWMLLG
ncbi:VOC family protein [Aestuariimicrobium soli]|uniref:VOC family protein n=1 Tax=Aestuariimicrobium soli TaxID=2035834 RepID=UPI003EBCB3E1